MGNISIGPWIVIVLIIFMPFFAISAVLKKTGHSRLWALLWFLAIAGFYGYVVLTYPG